MKTLLPLFILVLSFPAFAQSKITNPVRSVCTLTVKDSPVIRGLQLGMPEEDFKKAVGGDAWLSLTKANLADKPAFQGIDGITFDFYKGRLSRLQIDYDQSVRWKDAAEFVDALSDSLKVPGDAWIVNGMSQRGMMQCKGFSIEARAGSNWLILEDTDALAAFMDEQKRKEEEKKKNFKP